MIDKITSKASFFQKLKRRREEKSAHHLEETCIEAAYRTEAAYIEALSHLSDIRKEWHIKRLLAYVLPGKHAHRNPPKKVAT